MCVYISGRLSSLCLSNVLRSLPIYNYTYLPTSSTYHFIHIHPTHLSNRGSNYILKPPQFSRRYFIHYSKVGCFCFVFFVLFFVFFLCGFFSSTRDVCYFFLSQGMSHRLFWPWWCQVFAVILILASVLWIPGIALCKYFGFIGINEETPSFFPIDVLKEERKIIPHKSTDFERIVLGFRD